MAKTRQHDPNMAQPAPRGRASVRNIVSSTIPEPPDVKPVQLSNSFHDALSIIPRTTANLVLFTGKIQQSEENDAGQKVLLPYATINVDSEKIDEVRRDGEDHSKAPVLSVTISLENMAYVVLDLMGDLGQICDEVTQLSNGNLAVDRERMAQVRYFIAHIERQASLCKRKLDHVFGKPIVEQ